VAYVTRAAPFTATIRAYLRATSSSTGTTVEIGPRADYQLNASTGFVTLHLSGVAYESWHDIVPNSTRAVIYTFPNGNDQSSSRYVTIIYSVLEPLLTTSGTLTTVTRTTATPIRDDSTTVTSDPSAGSTTSTPQLAVARKSCSALMFGQQCGGDAPFVSTSEIVVEGLAQLELCTNYCRLSAFVGCCQSPLPPPHTRILPQLPLHSSRVQDRIHFICLASCF
jgi:hypothetical protein